MAKASQQNSSFLQALQKAAKSDLVDVRARIAELKAELQSLKQLKNAEIQSLSAAERILATRFGERPVTARGKLGESERDDFIRQIHELLEVDGPLSSAGIASRLEGMTPSRVGQICGKSDIFHKVDGLWTLAREGRR